MVTIGKVTRLGVLAAGLLTAGTAAAQTVTFASTLTPGQEIVPPPGMTPASPASGFGTLTYNQSLGTIFITLRAAGLTSGTIGVGPGGAPGHVHLGFPNQNGPIVIPVTNAPVGQTSFDIAQSFTFADLAAFGVAAPNITLLTTRLNAAVGAGEGTLPGLYFNIHTSRFPGGEIRGNLAVVPEPSTWALLGTGLGGVGLMARRRRQAR